MYNILNACCMSLLVFLNTFHACTLETLLMLLKCYLIGDMVCISYTQKPVRKGQLIIHHIITLVLIYVISHPLMSEFRYLTSDIVSLENSSLVLMISKITRLSIMRHLSAIVWFYYRIIYFPFLLQGIYHLADFEQVYHIITWQALQLIKYLGFIWTLEALRVPSKYLRPLIVSLTASMYPVVVDAYHKKQYLLAGHSTLLIASGIYHHSHFDIEGIGHVINVFTVYSYIIHTALIAHSAIYWQMLVCVIAAFSLVRLQNDKHDSLRDWDNIISLIPHATMHIVTGIGVYNGCL